MADRRELARRALEVFNTGDMDSIDELVSPELIDHDPQNPFNASRGPDAIKGIVSMYRAAFPDLALTVEEQCEDGDVVISRWSATGTNTGDLPGMPATGRSAKVGGIVMDRFDGDVVVESWGYWDTLGMLQQLGVVPSPQAAAS